MKQIYVIKNLINDKVYVGQANSAYDRFRRHRNNHISKDKQNLKIVEAMKELNPENFYFEILENCADDIADEREMFYIEKFDSFKNGYNKTLGGQGYTTLGKEDIDECNRLFCEGYTIMEIEGMTGINHKYIKKVLMPLHPDYEKICQRHTLMARWKSKTIPVKQYDLNGNFIRRYDSVNEALRTLGKKTGTSGIVKCCKHHQGYHTAYGYKWEYDTQ